MPKVGIKNISVSDHNHWLFTQLQLFRMYESGNKDMTQDHIMTELLGAKLLTDCNFNHFVDLNSVDRSGKKPTDLITEEIDKQKRK